MKKVSKLEGVANPQRIKADQERRRSGAAGPHDARPNRQRSRADARRAAIRDGGA